MKRSVLVVTSYSNLRDLRSKVLLSAGFEVKASKNAADAARLIADYRYDALLIGSEISRPSGEKIVTAFRRQNPGALVLFLGSHHPGPTFGDLADAVLPVPQPEAIFKLLNRTRGAAAED